MNEAPYGSWSSALSAEILAGAGVAFGDVRSADGRLYWTESLPAEAGAMGLFSMGADGSAVRLSAASANVRTRVHEYGGAAFAVVDGTAYYSNFADQLLYALPPGAAAATPITPSGYRYADCKPWIATDATALICVREDHTDPAHVSNSLVRLALDGAGAGSVLYGESDFVAYPRISPDGKHLAFITWNHPNMPWDGTELKLATLGRDGIMSVITIAGGPRESVLEPQWDPDGTLYFISDRSGFWNLYARRGADVQGVWPLAADFAAPLWQLGQANYVLLGNGHAIARMTDHGVDHLAILDLKHGTGRVLPLPYLEFQQLTRLDAGHVAMIAGSTTAPNCLLRVDAASGAAQVLRQAGQSILAPAAVSMAAAIDFPSAAGRTAHAFYYPPVNPEFAAPASSLPPLLTLVHGGPTSQASSAFALGVQFWTSRGFAVVDVNYGGSSGFGRAYREELQGNWGVLDVQDVAAAVSFLKDSGRVDATRTAIRGGSAGGYTVLAALSNYDVFSAGADYFGISDMTALAHDTHKFESRYLDSLIGPLPQAQALYDQRSPLSHLDGFKAPLIVFQGADDTVVPPNQSVRIVDALRKRKLPVAYLLFAGEGHGFRKPQSKLVALQSELSFYGQVFGFQPADSLPPLIIENLQQVR